MVDILHKVGIKPSSLDDAYQALTTREGLSAWWTSNTQGQSKAIAAMTRHMTGTREGWLAARLELLEMPPM